jgi:GT2 family glycosyltransferase
MGISVVMPVISDRFIGSLLSDIAGNDSIPNEIVVIDNSGMRIAEHVVGGFPTLPIRYLPQELNLGVNASWNLGLEATRSSLVSILNDDLVLPTSFFRIVAQTFENHGEVGFVVPSTFFPEIMNGKPGSWPVCNPGDIYEQPIALIPELQPLPARQGWAFTVRREAVEPIPHGCFTFFGDDWFWQCSQRKGYRAVTITNCQIYHYVGVSMDLEIRKRLKLPSLQEDQRAWAKIRRIRHG